MSLRKVYWHILRSSRGKRTDDRCNLMKRPLHMYSEISLPLFPLHGSCLAWLKKILLRKSQTLQWNFHSFQISAWWRGEHKAPSPLTPYIISRIHHSTRVASFGSGLLGGPCKVCRSQQRQKQTLAEGHECMWLEDGKMNYDRESWWAPAPARWIFT